MTFLWIILGALLLIILIGIVLERSRRPIGKAARKGASESFAELSQGVTAYRWHGSVRGPVLVAVHGLTTPSIVWDAIVGGLGAMGYRVLTYDLYGRGLSDAVRGAQDRTFFLQQLDDLLAHEGVNGEITFLGYSMGGAIAAAFTQEQSHRVSRLILLATAGVEMEEGLFARLCRRVPGIGDFVFSLIGGVRMRKSIAADVAVSKVTGLGKALHDQLRRRGYLQAVLASRRGILDETQKTTHQAIGRADVPVIAIWAEEDKVIPLAALGTLAQWNRNVRQETIPEAGHGIPFTHPEAVIGKLAEILVEPR